MCVVISALWKIDILIGDIVSGRKRFVGLPQLQPIGSGAVPVNGSRRLFQNLGTKGKTISLKKEMVPKHQTRRR
jgi:hypothetical protein